ncbi:hypothetical protein D3C85_1507130 [compost metagenome]
MQSAGDGQDTVTATEVGNPCRAEIAGQVRQKCPSADIQPFAAEYVGVVEQFDRRLVK